VLNTLVEIWQANAAGVYPGAGVVEDGFRGWGRVIPDFETGKWSVETIKPGSIMGRNGRITAPHLNLWLVARGINIGLSTRLYFGDEEKANAADPVLNLVEQAHRRDTLIAKKSGSAYRFDICLQGDAETVFFDI
jgi:protocatechuate 3,4-dioxygenase alpha subunit